ncbi:MAG: toxin [Acidiferrobacterales bacterium]
MKPFRLNHEKNERLKSERNVSFEEIVLAIEADGLLDIVVHSSPGKYPNQRLFIVAVEQYAYLVPFVEEADYYFLKTVIPSRKATRDYLKGGV